MTIEFKPTKRDKETVRLAEVEMPASPDLKEGERNVLHIALRYMKRGMSGMGRGFYVTVTGCSTDGTWERHALMADPATYVIVSPEARFSAKKLDKLAVSVQTDHLELIEKLVEEGRTYYEEVKGRAA